MTKVVVFLSKLFKQITGHRRHFGYHTSYAGHLVDSCNAID
jgi:hypothetical protein